ncbi:MAG: YeeE/YedE thiosulfate transporter family protein, partial [Pseudomonadota bacterium]
SLPLLISAGLAVGVGTRLANGCTSGHGVCGISRFSVRGIVATLFYILAGALTVVVVRHTLGLI